MISSPAVSRMLILAVVVVCCGAGYARADVLFVDDDAPAGGDGLSWATAYVDLQDALDNASTNGAVIEVRVAGGVYKPDRGTGDRQAAFSLLDNVAIRGGYAGHGAADPDARDVSEYETILSGDIDNNDIEELAEGIACVTYTEEPLSPECEKYDLNDDGDVDRYDLNMSDNSNNIVVAEGVNDTAALDGFVLTAGCSWNSFRGGAIYCEDSSPTIKNCVMRVNLCITWCGGGIHFESSDPILENCTFQRNAADGGGGGIFGEQGSNITLSGCRFEKNHSEFGSGLGTWDSNVYMTNCTFTDNRPETGEGNGCNCLGGEFRASGCRFVGNIGARGAGLHIGSTDVFLTGCEFSGNIISGEASERAYGGGIYHHTGLLSMVDCAFFGNVAELGGGVATTNCTVVAANCLFSGNRTRTLSGAGMNVCTLGTNRCTLTNCTFYRNTRDASASTTLGSGLAGSVGISLTMTNCIFRENGSSDFDQIYGAEFLDFSYSNIQGLDYYAGNNNIDVEPEFVDPLGADGLVGTADDNLRLLRTSPCADAGDNEADTDLVAKSVEPLPNTDLDGNPRFVDTPRRDTGNAGETGLAVVDMGAYEIQEVGDCNGNGVSDDEDVAGGTSENCNTNAFPDECELAGNDCNESGVPDDCELIGNDCNGNGIPDDCELVANDCNLNGVPDECELEGNDCNGTGIPDDCELDGNDCNENGLPDECEYAALILPGSGPVDVIACSNGVTTFSVAAGESASSLQWYKDDHSNPLSDVYGKIEGAQDSTLRILGIEDGDEGVYFCEVADGCVVRASGDAELTIIARPLVRSWANDAAVCEGGSVVLSITHDGSADFTYEYVWRKDGVALANQPRFRVLSISGASVDDDGLYTCEVINRQCGMSELSPEMDVSVRGALFVEQPATQCHLSGETAVFDMAVEYENPISGYVWQRWYGSPYNRWINLGAPAAGEILPLEVTVAADGLYRGAVYLDNACWSYSEPAVLHVGDATGDLDGDGDVDLMDMGRFTECFGQDSDVEPRCSCADFDWAETVIDLNDWSAMEAEVTGP